MQNRYFAVFSNRPNMLVAQWLVEGVFQRAREVNCPQFVETFIGSDIANNKLGGCAGLMAQVRNGEEARALKSFRIPVINYSNSVGRWSGMGNVLSDDVAVGRMAGSYMVSRGYRQFLGIGQVGRQFSAERLRGFRSVVEEKGGKVVLLEVTGVVESTLWSPQRYLEEMWEQLRAPLLNLPLEAGIFAVSDWLAWPLTRLLEERTPERSYTTCLVGVDNMQDAMFDPRKSAGLSSIVPGFRQIGREALDLLMEHRDEDGSAIASVSRRCPPERLMERASSAGPACADPLTAKILRQMWIRLRSGLPIEIEEMARKEGMTTRTLERKFSTHLDMSAREWRATMRIDYARELLRETGRPVGEIAITCGYSDAAAFSSAFKKATGRSPRVWREEN